MKVKNIKDKRGKKHLASNEADNPEDAFNILSDGGSAIRFPEREDKTRISHTGQRTTANNTDLGMNIKDDMSVFIPEQSTEQRNPSKAVNKDKEHVVAVLKYIDGNDDTEALYVVLELYLTKDGKDCELHHTPKSKELSPMPLDFARLQCEKVASEKCLRCTGYTPDRDKLARKLHF